MPDQIEYINILDALDDWWSADGPQSSDIIARITSSNSERFVVNINSPGGSAAGGLAIYNALRNSDTPVEVNILGLAASAASIIAMAGDEIRIAKSAMLMIHNASALTIGDKGVHTKEVEVLGKFDDAMARVYTRRTGRAEEEIKGLMDAETWLDGEEAVAFGFATSLLEDERGAAAKVIPFSSSPRFRNIPDNVAHLFKGATLQPAKPQPVAACSAHKEKTVMPQTDKVPEPVAPVAAPDPETQIKAKAEANPTAFMPIVNLCNVANVPAEDTLAYITAGKTYDQVLADLQAKRNAEPPTASVQPTARVLPGERNERETFREQAALGLYARGGGKLTAEQDEKARPFRAHRLEDLAVESLVRAGLPVPRGDREEMFKAAFRGASGLQGVSFQGDGIRAQAYNHQTGDFPLILVDAMNKALQQGYTDARVTYPAWVRTVPFSDFKNRYVNRLSETPDPQRVNENGELREVKLVEEGENYTIDTFGSLISITRKTLINDDLDAFSRIPRQFGSAARRKIQKAISAIINTGDTAIAMSDTEYLFSSAHANIITAAGGALSVDSFNTARVLMQKQTGPNGELIDVQARFLLVPPGLYFTAFQIVNSTALPAASFSSGVVNPFQGSLEILEDPFMSAAGDSGSDIKWALATDSANLDTVELGLLNGRDAPVIEVGEVFDVLGMKVRNYIDFGVKAIDWRGLLKSNGVAPGE